MKKKVKTKRKKNKSKMSIKKKMGEKEFCKKCKDELSTCYECEDKICMKCEGEPHPFESITFGNAECECCGGYVCWKCKVECKVCDIILCNSCNNDLPCDCVNEQEGNDGYEQYNQNSEMSDFSCVPFFGEIVVTHPENF